MDRYAVVWTRTAQGPVPMGQLVHTGRELRFSYAPEFLADVPAPGFALLAGPALFGAQPVLHAASELLPLHPRLMALVPPQRPNNLQRRVYAAILAARRPPPAPGFETEWELLMLAGRGGVGHLDVFRDDREALAWYARAPAQAFALDHPSALWDWLRREINLDAAEADTALDLAALIGPTPSVGGMTPKLLLAIPDPDHAPWRGAIAPPDTRERDGVPYVDVVLKIEQPEYRGLVALEGLCLELHRELGFTVPRAWQTTVEDVPVLAVARFDRSDDGLPIPLESLFCVMASGARDVRTAADVDMARVGRMLATLAGVVHLDARAAQREVYRRLLMALLTGNGDLHLENLALLGGPQAVRVAPVFDPAPMRAWPRHDLLAAIPFEMQGSLRDSVLALGSAFGLTPRKAAAELDALHTATASYTERVQALAAVPAATRTRLVSRVEQARERLRKS